MSDVELVENRYRTSLGSASPRAWAQVEEARDAFGAVRRAMEAGAWDSAAAREFSTGCRDSLASGVAAAEDCAEVVDARYRREPVKVERDDRRARFS